MDDFWVFGYGSLMWNPGFVYKERLKARAFGYRRSLCVRSFVHRGTEENPGLVLGLDRGGSCSGVAFRIDNTDRDAVLEYLRKRELVTHVYKERVMPVVVDGGRQVDAITYVVDRNHRQYSGALDIAAAAHIVHGAMGQSGPNDAYVYNTLAHLQEMGIRDLWLEQVAETINAMRAQASSG